MHVAGRVWRVHRAAYEAAFGPIPAGLVVCHTCDNRRCFNLDHLWLGTRAENNTDRHLKGRDCQGTEVHCAKLTEADVSEIRRLYYRGNGFGDYGNGMKLAQRYGVSNKVIGDVVRRKTWKHVA